jgi:Autotransporter beta-domain
MRAMPVRSIAVLAAFVAALVLAVWSAPERAQAQTVPHQDDGDCDDVIVGPRGKPVFDLLLQLGCTRNQTNSVTLLYQPEVIRNIVARRLGAVSICSSEEDRNRPPEERQDCAQVNGLLIAPVADTGTPAQRRWNVWFDGKGTWIASGQHDQTPTEGPLFNGSAGIDYKLTDKIVVGLIATTEASDLDIAGIFPGSLEASGFGGGAYLGATLYKNLVFNALATGAAINTDMDFGGVTADIDAERVQVSAGLTDTFYFGQTRLSPSVTFAWANEFQHHFVDSGGFFNPAQTIESGVLTFGNILGHTFSLAGGQAIEPWFGANLDWTLINQIDVSGAGKTKLGDLLDLRLQAGLNWTIRENMQLALTGEVGGLILRDQDSYAGEANLAIQF